MALKYGISVVLVIIYLTCFSETKNPCDYHMSINITDGVKIENDVIIHNDLDYTPDQYFTHLEDDNTTSIRGCVCNKRDCMRKCCPDGYVFENKSCVESDDPMVHPFNPPIYSATNLIPNMNATYRFALVYGNPCLDGQRYVLNPYTNESSAKEDSFYLQLNGSLYLPNHSKGPKNYSQMSYCMDAFPFDPYEESDSWTTKYLVLFCFESGSDSNFDFSLYSIGMLISIPFLLATFLVYAIIPELRNLHGKSLMSYVASLMVAYGFLASVQLYTSVGNAPMYSKTCITVAFIIYFCFMVSFFWLNVMCFDIWLTFSGIRAPRMGARRVAERRRFLYYCLYAWGVPLLLTGTVALMQFHPDIPKQHVRPEFGVQKCWFREKPGELVYFYTPMIVLGVCNMVLFASTSCRILQINKETAMLKTGDSSRHDQYSNDKQRFNLYFKLFLVMGINWAAEWVSFAAGGPDYLWIITDFANTILGVFIFVIFVWKKKIKKLLIKRYYLLRYGSTSMTGRSSSRFRSANLSTTSGLETDRSFISQDESAVMKLKTIK